MNLGVVIAVQEKCIGTFHANVCESSSFWQPEIPHRSHFRTEPGGYCAEPGGYFAHGATIRRNRGVQEHLGKNSRVYGSQNGVKMDAKSGPGQTVKTVLPST